MAIEQNMNSHIIKDICERGSKLLKGDPLEQEESKENSVLGVETKMNLEQDSACKQQKQGESIFNENIDVQSSKKKVTNEDL